MNVKVYFHQSHTICKEVDAKTDIDNISSPKIHLLQNLQQSTLNGGDLISSHGYCKNSKGIVLYIQCQCSKKYEESSKK